MEYAALAENHHFQVPPDAYWNQVGEVTTSVGMALKTLWGKLKSNPDNIWYWGMHLDNEKGSVHAKTYNLLEIGDLPVQKRDVTPVNCKKDRNVYTVEATFAG